MNYLFFEGNVYPLYAGKTYQLGSSVDSNIYLPIFENVVLEVKENGVELLGETYSYGYHLVPIAENINANPICFVPYMSGVQTMAKRRIWSFGLTNIPAYPCNMSATMKSY